MTRPAPIQSQALLHTLLLIALCGVLYFPYLGQVPFFDKGEPREALAVQDIVQRGPKEPLLFVGRRNCGRQAVTIFDHYARRLTHQLASVRLAA